MVFATKRVVLSLFVGIVLGGVMMNYQHLMGTFNYIYEKISTVLYSFEPTQDGTSILVLKYSSIYVFGFLIVLGILTQTISHSGAVNAFVKWARHRIKTPQGSEFIAFIAGIIIFIDDYFNALTVGQISKSLNDANHSTRERLAYVIDSTSAPVCILMPISSWGAYILGIMHSSVPESVGDGLFVLIHSVWSNYYAWFALLAVFLTIYWQINLPAMVKNKNIGVRDFLSSEELNKPSSSVWLLIVPVIVLIISIAFMILWTGFEAGRQNTLFSMLKNTDTAFSLFYGGLFALIVSVLISIRHLNKSSFILMVTDGIKSMLPAILILILAWAIGPVISDDMQTGVYLANISKDFLSESAGLAMPMVLFAISGFIAFATGTSWGTFAIMLPIGVSLAIASGGDAILCISSVLAGAVYGDHASPISDTTILSATGAGCSVQSHFITQFPYASTAAVVAMISFGVASFSSSIMIGYVIGIILLVGIFYYYKAFLSKKIF
ncbi:Na+/H+ antiporter NhaC family protein [Helicobacter sp. faydin-H76]|uniref:Na+/H+ antiporter NhaC family protein n=2 Tax=Helicobacter cappadocius TaxID=3063998 RepID=A0AA90PW18_9HELI|nr:MULTISPECIES: Na+/H+ antiporter NhaC family protein [unclassified Helicobacter]MDO7253416.1 Na+/H+ antiporter NhaC family protein [Helicobacter sp. faydin-H75]MDP2539320.1 Na+/H+ antiporter NhaC family protein [Helicobacter sp. faydin-H76]